MLATAKGFYGKQFTEKVSLRLTEIFEPLVAIANGGDDKDISRAIEAAESHINEYFQQLKNQIPGYSLASLPATCDSPEPQTTPINLNREVTDNEPILEPEFD